MAKLILIDGSSLLHRAFYALPLLSNSRGEYTNAVYGFINMLNKLLEGQKPDFLLVCFDKSRVTFRNQLAADYKGTRKETPLELRGQFELPGGKQMPADAELTAWWLGGENADPKVDPKAVKYDTITYDDVLAQHLQVMDSTATSLSMDNKIPVLLFALKDPQNIIRAVMGEKIGTIVKG